jgi:hypothetical protein
VLSQENALIPEDFMIVNNRIVLSSGHPAQILKKTAQDGFIATGIPRLHDLDQCLAALVNVASHMVT